MEDVFEAVWWGRSAAMAWVLTRDKAFVQSQFDRNENDINLSEAFARHAQGRKFSEVPVPTLDAAWSALQREMIAGRIRTVGEPFERTDYGDGDIVTSSEPARSIFKGELASLQPPQGADEDFLTHIQYTAGPRSSVGNLRGYQQIRLFRDDVLAAFPEVEFGTATGSARFASNFNDPKSPRWNIYDEPHFASMRQLLEKGSARSIADAARKVVQTNDVPGGGTSESRQKRLQRGYPRWEEAARIPKTPG